MPLATLLTCYLLTAPAADGALLLVDFDTVTDLAAIGSGSGQLVDDGAGGKALRITNADPAASQAFQVPVTAELAGRQIQIEARVRIEGVSQPPQHWNGVKVMLILETAAGKQHPQIGLPVGDADWATYRRSLRVSAAVTKATLILGLERVSGTVLIDHVVIRPVSRAAPGLRQERRFVGHDLPRLRGAMIGPRFREQDFHEVAAWGANHVRWQLNWTPMAQAAELAQDLAGYDTWLAGALAEADQALDLAEELGVVVLLDLHTPPGGRAEAGVCRMFQQPHYQDKLVEVWETIAQRYRGRRVIWAYDLINEPVEGKVAADCQNWRDLATRVVDAIRAIEPDRACLVEPSPWGGPGGFDSFLPLERDRIIYGFHMYLPHEFTHQGVHDNPLGLTYPGVVGGLHWDREQLREAMLPAIQFQQEFNVHIHVGEFSAARWSPENSAFRWLRDVIDLFEEYGWDWAYHAWREWDGWSVEHGVDQENRQRLTTITDRGQLLRDWWAKNQRPDWQPGQ